MDSTEGLHNAVCGGDLNMICLLLDTGVDINQRNSLKKPPLYAAILKGKLKTIRLLIQHGADVFLDNNLLKVGAL